MAKLLLIIESDDGVQVDDAEILFDCDEDAAEAFNDVLSEFEEEEEPEGVIDAEVLPP